MVQLMTNLVGRAVEWYKATDAMTGPRIKGRIIAAYVAEGVDRLSYIKVLVRPADGTNLQEIPATWLYLPGDQLPT